MRCIAFSLLVCACGVAHANNKLDDESCTVSEEQVPASSSALLQVQASKEAHNRSNAKLSLILQEERARGCSFHLVGDQDGSRPCAALKGKSYVSGKVATLNQAGYEQTARLCCHHEMSLFVRREIQRQGFDLCDLSDLHGFVHWYDCTNDLKTYKEMEKEISGVMTSVCPWLGKSGACPVRDPVHCGKVGNSCSNFPEDSMPGSTAPLSQEGYAGVAKRCCAKEMDRFIRRLISKGDGMGFYVCDEGAFNGFLHWFDCTSDDQTFDKLKEGIMIARSGLPPMCPWLGGIGQACPAKGHNCPVVEIPEPAAHRRRMACR